MEVDLKAIITQAVYTAPKFKIINGEACLNGTLCHEEQDRERLTKDNYIKSFLSSDLIEPLKVLAEYHNKRLACFYLERLRQTRDIEEVSIEVSKIYFLSDTQKQTLRQLVGFIYQEDINEREDLQLKQFCKDYLNCILLSLINSLNTSDHSKWDKQKNNQYPKPLELSDKNLKMRRDSLLQNMRKICINDDDHIRILDAVSNGEVELVKKLITPESREGVVNKALEIALYDGNTELIKVLLKNACKVSTGNKQEILCSAVLFKNYDLVKYMLEEEIEGNRGSSKPLLIYAVANNREDIVKLLLKYEADVDLKDHQGMTALMIAASWGFKDIAEVLLDHGSCPDKQDNNGRTALIIAVMMDYMYRLDFINTNSSNQEQILSRINCN